MKMLGNTTKYSLCFSFRPDGYFLFLNCFAPEKLRFWPQTRRASAGILCVWPACATKYPVKISLYQAYFFLSQHAQDHSVLFLSYYLCTLIVGVHGSQLPLRQMLLQLRFQLFCKTCLSGDGKQGGPRSRDTHGICAAYFRC